MNRPWAQFDAELKKRNKPLTWLANQLGCTIQRVQNWKTRGVPRAAFEEVATAFGESIDWVAGLAPPKSAAAETPSAEAMRIAVIYDLLTSQERARFIRMFVAALDPRAELDPIKEMANQSLQDLIDEHRKSRPADLTNLHEMPPPRPIRQISNPARKAAKRREIKR